MQFRLVVLINPFFIIKTSHSVISVRRFRSVKISYLFPFVVEQDEFRVCKSNQFLKKYYIKYKEQIENYFNQ